MLAWHVLEVVSFGNFKANGRGTVSLPVRSSEERRRATVPPARVPEKNLCQFRSRMVRDYEIEHLAEA